MVTHYFFLQNLLGAGVRATPGLPDPKSEFSPQRHRCPVLGPFLTDLTGESSQADC